MPLSSALLLCLSLAAPFDAKDDYIDIPVGYDWPTIWWIPNSVSSPMLIMDTDAPESPIPQQYDEQSEPPTTPQTAIETSVCSMHDTVMHCVMNQPCNHLRSLLIVSGRFADIICNGVHKPGSPCW